jgi:hypothetical protein
VDVVTRFPDECRYLLETLREVYKHDAFCRRQEMSAEERLQPQVGATAGVQIKFTGVGRAA